MGVTKCVIQYRIQYQFYILTSTLGFLILKLFLTNNGYKK
jgi:hypothetical protein